MRYATSPVIDESLAVSAVETQAPSVFSTELATTAPADKKQDGGLVLPSASSAERLVGGDLNALPIVALHMLGRGALVGLGIACVNGLNWNTVKYGLAGSASIEAFVLAFAAYKANRAKAESKPA